MKQQKKKEEMVDKLLHDSKGEKLTREEFAQMITELVQETGKSRMEVIRELDRLLEIRTKNIGK